MMLRPRHSSDGVAAATFWINLRRCKVSAFAAASIISLCAWSGADERSALASKEFDRATRAAARGDYAEAAAAFEQAYRLVAHAATLFNAALAWETAGNRARAADAYAGALSRGGLGEPQVRDARKRLEHLESHLGRIDIDAPSGTLVSVAHVLHSPVPVRVHVDRGQHDVRFSLASGQSEVLRVTAGAAPVQVRFDPEAAAQGRQDATQAVSDSAAQTGARSNLAGWTAVGAGAVLAGATAYVGLQALSARDEFDDSGHTDANAHDRAESLRTWTNITLAGAVVASGLGVYLLVRKPEGGARASSAPQRSGLQVGWASVLYSTQF